MNKSNPFNKTISIPELKGLAYALQLLLNSEGDLPDNRVKLTLEFVKEIIEDSE